MGSADAGRATIQALRTSQPMKPAGVANFGVMISVFSVVMVLVPCALLIVCGHPSCGAAAPATHQALKGSGQTTKITAGRKPYRETVNLLVP